MRHLEQFCDALTKLGIPAYTSLEGETMVGFPSTLRLSDGSSLHLDLPDAALLDQLDPEALGLAVVNTQGVVRKTWGIARTLKTMGPGGNLLETDLAPWIVGAFRGQSSTTYYQGNRYFFGSIHRPDGNEVLILVADAQDEEEQRQIAVRYEFEARALRKIGKVLTMNQTLEPISYAAVHEIASVAELSAVLLWVQDESGQFELKSSVGVTRKGASVLERIHADGSCTCAAELVLVKKEPFLVRQVTGNMLTSELEAKFCYLKPGGMMAFPLMIGNNLLGVLELIGRDADLTFFERREFFETLTEHLALALNSALMFESSERLATIDPLTGVSNHRAMQEFLHRRIYEALRNEQQLGVIMLDVDHFRRFNEEEGHDAGDLVLQKVVEAIKSAIRPYDLAARYGGEEFTVILPNSSSDEALRVAERIRRRIEQIEFQAASGQRRTVTASLGVAILAEDRREPQALLKAADVALYQAKGAGRNRCVLFENAQVEATSDLVEVAGAETLLPTKWRKEGQRFWKETESHLAKLQEELRLTASQIQLLKSLSYWAPFVLGQPEATLQKALKKLQGEPEMASLWVLIHGLRQRADQGEELPLLSQIVAIVYEAEREGGRAFVSDPNRFDARLLQRFLTLTHAA